MRKIKIGSRDSELALTQANMVIEALKREFPNYEYEIVKIKTKGDKILNVTLDKIGGKGLFVKEIQWALMDKTVDLAVHSMKDMPGETPEELVLAAITKREDPRDVLVSEKNYSLEDLPKNAKIGSSSLRRKSQLSALREDIRLVDIRGNLGTRLGKMKSEKLDGIILAAAGLKRLKHDTKNYYFFNIEEYTPAVGQGALGCEVRKDDGEILSMMDKLNHVDTYNCVMAEREFLKKLEGGCHIPIGAYAEKIGEKIKITGMVASPDGSKIIRESMEGDFNDYLNLGNKIGEKIIGLGGKSLLKSGGSQCE